MGWIAGFKGLRKIGAPPLIAVLALVAVFVIGRVVSGDDQADGTAA